MNEAWKKKLRDTSRRERAAVLVLVVGGIILGADQFVISPALASIKKTNARMSELQMERSRLELELGAASVDLGEHPLKAQLQAKTSELQGSVLPLLAKARASLLAPEQVSSFMKDMIPNQQRIKLTALQSGASAAEARSPGIHRHPFVVEFEGPYLDMVTHLQRLEASPWRLSMERMALKTTDKPAATVHLTLNLSAFSDSPTWLSSEGKNKPANPNRIKP